MTYQYPDKNDSLTIELINSEFNSEYWAKSEDYVLSKAIEKIKNLREKDDDKRLLDIGCGMGRLLHTFAPFVDTITAVEPDSSRFAEAAEEGSKVSVSLGKNIDVINGDITSITSTNRYDIVLSSHVLQHIPRDMARELIESMSDKLEEGGLLILTTTHAPAGEDLYFKEEWKGENRYSQPISAEQFDSYFNTPGVLPVRLFAEQTIQDMAKAANLVLENVYCYHFKDHNSVDEDLHANETASTSTARDVMYIFRKKETYIDANVGYHFNFSIFDEEIGLRIDDEKELRESIKAYYQDVVFYDDKNADQERIFEDLHTSESFLHGSGLPFNCFRVLIKDYSLTFDRYDVFDSGVLVTVFPENDTVQLSIGLSLKNLKVDDLVYMRHVQGNGAKLTNKDGRNLSVTDIYNEVAKSLGRKITDKEDGYIIEIKSFGEETSIDTIIDSNSKELYGIMSGDEGWRHVPKELSKQRLLNQWGSRDFIRLISFGSNTLFLNLSKCAAASIYRENRRIFDNQFYGDINPYFLMDNNFAGINHGVFFSVELVMVIKTICNRILRRQALLHKSSGNNVQKDIKQTKLFRSELLTTLRKVENISITEVGEMERVFLASQEIEPIIEKIKYLLELVESELDLLYQNSTNRLVNILTIAGLLLSAIGVIAQIYSVL